MKTNAKTAPKKTPRGAIKSRSLDHRPKVESLLPQWVIGAYDGPSDGKLSTKEGYPFSK